MRLIDADKLSSKSCPMGKRKYCSNCGEKRTIKNPYTNQSISCDDIRFDFLQMINREKAVKAIPIEWIKKYIENHTYEMVNPKYVYDIYNYVKFTEEPLDYKLNVMPIQVQVMLVDWEQENE